MSFISNAPLIFAKHSRETQKLVQINSRISGAKRARIFGTASRAKGDPAIVPQNAPGDARRNAAKASGLRHVIKKPPKLMDEK
jgi:hypothetical protein